MDHRVSIPLIGSNLFKSEEAVEALKQLESVSIPLIGSNLFK